MSCGSRIRQHLLVSFFFCGIFFPVFVATQSRPLNCNSIEKGVDYVGNDIGNSLSANPEGCCLICKQKTGCGAYSWTTLNGGTCWLKSAKGATKSDPNVQSATMIVGSTPTITCSVIENGVDYVNNDIGNAPSSTAEGCCDSCRGKSGCNAFSWTNLNGGTCWLKSSKGTTKADPNVRSGSILSTINGCGAIQNDVDYTGNDIGNAPSSAAEGCCNLCKAKSGCTAYSWSNFNGGTCWLKSVKGTTSAKPGVRSGTILPPSGCTYEQGIDYIGNDIKNVRGDASMCCSFCQSTNGCKAYSWTNFNGGTCWLKSAKTGTTFNKYVISGTLEL